MIIQRLAMTALPQFAHAHRVNTNGYLLWWWENVGFGGYMNEQQFQAEVMDELRQREEMDRQDQRQAMLEELRKQDAKVIMRKEKK